MIGFLRVHPGWAGLLGSLVMAGVLWCGWRVGPYIWDDSEDNPLPEDEFDWPERQAEHWDEMGPEEQADQLIAEWKGGPGTFHQCPGRGCLECETQPFSLWDAWWADLDGLERECWLVRVTAEDQDREWQALKDETRALCPLAA